MRSERDTKPLLASNPEQAGAPPPPPSPPRKREREEAVPAASSYITTPAPVAPPSRRSSASSAPTPTHPIDRANGRTTNRPDRNRTSRLPAPETYRRVSPGPARTVRRRARR